MTGNPSEITIGKLTKSVHSLGNRIVSIEKVFGVIDDFRIFIGKSS